MSKRPHEPDTAFSIACWQAPAMEREVQGLITGLRWCLCYHCGCLFAAPTKPFEDEYKVPDCPARSMQ